MSNNSRVRLVGYVSRVVVIIAGTCQEVKVRCRVSHWGSCDSAGGRKRLHVACGWRNVICEKGISSDDWTGLDAGGLIVVTVPFPHLRPS